MKKHLMIDDEQADGHALMDEHMANIRLGAETEFAPELMATLRPLLGASPPSRNLPGGPYLRDAAARLAVSSRLPRPAHRRRNDRCLHRILADEPGRRSARDLLGALESLYFETRLRKADALREEVESFLG